MKSFFLKTARLGFAVWSMDDLPDALELWGDPEVTRYITASGIMSESDVRARLEKEIEIYDKTNIQYWPLYLKESGECIGCCGLRPYDDDKNILEMGVHIKPRFWKKGYANEACLAVMEYAFDLLGADGLFAGHNPENQTSAQLLKKLGFVYMHDEFYPPTGLMHPSYMLTKKQFLVLK